MNTPTPGNPNTRPVPPRRLRKVAAGAALFIAGGYLSPLGNGGDGQNEATNGSDVPVTSPSFEPVQDELGDPSTTITEVTTTTTTTTPEATQSTTTEPETVLPPHEAYALGLVSPERNDPLKDFISEKTRTVFELFKDRQDDSIKIVSLGALSNGGPNTEITISDKTPSGRPYEIFITGDSSFEAQLGELPTMADIASGEFDTAGFSAKVQYSDEELGDNERPVDDRVFGVAIAPSTTGTGESFLTAYSAKVGSAENGDVILSRTDVGENFVMKYDVDPARNIYYKLIKPEMLSEPAALAEADQNAAVTLNLVIDNLTK